MTAYLYGEIDHCSAVLIRESIDMAIERNRPRLLKLNFKSVSFMDSSGVGLVMGRYKSAQRYGGSTEVEGLSKIAEKIMLMSGLQNIIKLNKAK